MQWQIVLVSGMLLLGVAVGVAGLKRRTKPEQQRIAEAEQSFFLGAKPRVEVGGYEANLKREPLTRLALRHGYELERTELRGAGQMKSLKYHFVLRGSDARPAPFLPESPDHDAYMRWEMARNRKVRRYYAVVSAVLISIVGLLAVVAFAEI